MARFCLFFSFSLLAAVGHIEEHEFVGRKYFIQIFIARIMSGAVCDRDETQFRTSKIGQYVNATIKQLPRVLLRVTYSRR